MPLYLVVVLLRTNEVWTGLLAANDAHEGSLVRHVMLVDLVDELGLALRNGLVIHQTDLPLCHLC